MTKRKEARRELLKHDEFLSTMELGARYIQNNPKTVGAWVGAIVIILAAIAGWMNYRHVAADKDAAALYRVEKSFLRPLDDPFAAIQFKMPKEKNEAALAELDTYLETAKGNSRSQALIYKAACEMELGKTQEAEKTYKELSKGKGAFAMMAQFALGDLAIGRKEYDQAISSYKQILSNPEKHLFADLATFRIAKAYQAKGDLKNAELELEGLVQKYDALDVAEQPPVHRDAKTLLEEIKSEKEPS